MRMSRYMMVLTASAAVAVGSATTAQASTVLFNPAGTGASGAITIDLLDPIVGNSISLGLSSTSAVGTVGTLLFQANLGTAGNTQGSPAVETTVFTNGASGEFFTFAAAFSEKVTANTGGSNPILAFGPTSGSTNGSFDMYAQTSDGSDLNGTCFVNCGSNPAILTGTILNNSDFSGGFLANTSNPVQALDQFGSNNYPSTNTITGNGSFTADVLVTGVNANYFPGLVPGTVLVFATSENVLPFKQADPSACFSSNAVTSCDTAGVSSVGAVNGLGGNTMLQTDANLSFGTVSPVPEPATLSLLGLGLVAGATQIRKRFGRK